jgi:hypothetical protein
MNMQEYINNNDDTLNKDSSIKEFLKEGIENAMVGQPLYKNKDGSREAFLIETKKQEFLFYKRLGKISVYYDDKSSWNPNPFKDVVQYIKKDKGDIYQGNYILTLATGDNESERKIIEKNLEELKVSHPEAYEKLISMNIEDFYSKSGDITKASVSVQDIMLLCNFIKEHKFSKKIFSPNIFEEMGREFATVVHKDVADILPKLNFVLEQSLEQGYTNKKPYVFNDSDNHVWVPTIPNAVCFDSQNFGFLSVRGKTTEDWTVYQFSNEGHVRCRTDKDVIKHLQNDSIDLLKDIVLIIENGQVKYAHGFADSFKFELSSSTQQMIEESGKHPDYGVDLTSYEYQRKYYEKLYGLNEFKFLCQAFLPIGGGFEFENGKLITKRISFVPEVLNETNKQVIQDDNKEINYCYPDRLKEIKKVGFLEKEWEDGLKKLVADLETYQPTVVAAGGYASCTVPEAIKKGKEVLKVLEKNKKNKLAM